MRNYIWLFGLSLAVWLCLSSSFHAHELIAAVVVSLLVAGFMGRRYARLGLPPFGVRRAWFFVCYLGVLAIEVTKANFDVAYRVLHPRMPIRPGIVTIKTNLKQDVAKLMLANSITLTPGTFTVDVVGDTLLVHWIHVESEDIDEATKRIGDKFERYLGPVFA